VRWTSPYRAFSSAAVLFVLCASLALSAATAAADGPHDGHDPHDLPPGWLLYDGGALLEPDVLPGATPLELAIDFFASGSPPVKWRTDLNPTIPICTVQANRPASISDVAFREAVTLGVQAWSDAQAAVGFNYTGDCPSGTWSQNNGINEIGWDDARNVVRSPAAGVTFGRWLDRLSSRDFQETDIILDHELNITTACLNSVVAHELGHALGFGHSDTRGDLMFPSFDPNDPSTCPGRPSAAEAALLASLYGVNRTPVISSSGLEQNVAAGSRVIVSVSATDPDGDALTYTWTQTGGPAVAFSPSGGRIAFDSPNQPGAMLRFRVSVRDRFLHTATAEVVVRLFALNAPPTVPPYLDDFGVSADGNRLALRFTEAVGHTEYRFCATPPTFTTPSCQTAAKPQGEITWDTILTSAVENEPERIFTTGARRVTLQACNTQGCAQDNVTEILAGGLRWTAHRVDYDYLAVTYDIPGTTVRFTIGVVQNLSDVPRNFQLYSGSVITPRDKLILDCGSVRPGDICIGFLSPSDAGHGTHVTIRSTRNTTPAIENRIRVR